MNKKANTAGIVVIIVFLLIFAGCWYLMSGDSDSGSSSKTSSSKARLGDACTLSVSGSDTVNVARTKDALDEMTKAATAGDKVGYTQVYYSGRAFMVKRGTKAKIIDQTIGTRKVRILSGDYSGEAGWIPYEWCI